MPCLPIHQVCKIIPSAYGVGFPEILPLTLLCGQLFLVSAINPIIMCSI